jgi:hypothetical protein
MKFGGHVRALFPCCSHPLSNLFSAMLQPMMITLVPIVDGYIDRLTMFQYVELAVVLELLYVIHGHKKCDIIHVLIYFIGLV